MNYSWDLVRNQVREFRAKLHSIYQPQALATVKDFIFDSSHNLYFLSDYLTITNEASPNRYLHLYKVNVNQGNRDHLQAKQSKRD